MITNSQRPAYPIKGDSVSTILFPIIPDKTSSFVKIKDCKSNADIKNTTIPKSFKKSFFCSSLKFKIYKGYKNKNK